MKFGNNMKRIFSALLVFVLVFSLIPMNVHAATSNVVDAAILFSDLHSSESNYKTSELGALLKAAKNTGNTFTSVTSCGDAFSVNYDSGNSGFNKYVGYTSTLTNTVLGSNGLNDPTVDVNYVWSDHDRYAVQEDGKTPLDKTSYVAYGAGADGIIGTADDGNYYIYVLSMADTSTNDRYGAGFLSNRAANGFTATVDQAIANFQADAAKMHKDRPLLIASHQPLLDNRNDNGHAYSWATAINKVAEEMDVAFFFGHNHKYDKSSDYYYAKGSTMSVCSDSSGNAKSVKLNFEHICAGYLEPKSTTSYSSSGTRMGTGIVVVIYEDSIRYTTYNANGVYTGNYALDVTVTRDHATVAAPETPAPTEPEVTEPAPTEPEATEPVPTTPAPTEPEVTEPAPTEPEVSGKIWRQATSIEAGKKYMLVNYGYNGSGIETYAVNSSAGATAVTVKTDSTGAYIVSDDDSLAWTAAAKNSQFTLKNADNGKYLRAASSAYGSTGQTISVNSSTGTYSYWSLETKDSKQVLAVRRSGSSNYYPVRYTGSNFQSFTSSQVSKMSNWLVVFVETDEDAHQHKFTTVTVAATCTTDGSVTSTCACGQKTTEVLKALGHKYTCVETAATCTVTGSKVYTCSVCGDTYSEAIPATGHSYTSKTTAATCETNGYTVYTCACGDSYTEVLAATGHSYTAKVTAPTCTTEGYTTYTCSCGDSYVADEVAALGHRYTAKVTAPTCTAEGYTTYTCSCGDSYVADEVAALGHSYTAKVTVPTCTTEGYTTYTCSCGHSYTADRVAALGHSYSEKYTAPTCVTYGYTTYTCACGTTYTETNASPLGHSYTAAEVDGYMVYTCSACGDSYSEKLAADLSYEKVSTLSNSNRYVITLTSSGKYYVLSHANNTLSAVQVTVSNGVITSEITEDMVWDYSNKIFSYEDDDTTYNLYAKSSKLSLNTSKSSQVSIRNNKLKVGNYYLRYSSSKISVTSSSSSATTLALFKEVQN